MITRNTITQRGVNVADRETLLVLTASDEAIHQSRSLRAMLAAPRVAGPCERYVCEYIRADEPSYVDSDDDVIRVEGPVEAEPDTGVHGRACLPSSSWEEDLG